MTGRRKKTSGDRRGLRGRAVGAAVHPKQRGPNRPGRGRQRQRLIDACISALHLFGPSRTTVEKVVAIAKMSPGIVRFYFDSKAAMLVASLQFLAAEFEEQVLTPVAKLRATPVAALRLMVDLYLDPEIASPRKVSVWYAFWGEASSRQEYYDICGQKDESFAALVRELVQALIVSTSQRQLDPDGVALGLIGSLEMMWQEFAFRSEEDIDRGRARERCLGYLRSVFPGQFAEAATPAGAAPGRWGGRRLGRWGYDHPGILARERERLFAPSWGFIGHVSELPRNRDYLALDTGAERALAVRDDQGTVNVLRNSCPGAPHVLVMDRRGRLEGDIECRAHGLRFSIEGHPVSGALNCSLPRLECRVSAGLIFARPTGVVRPENLPEPFEMALPMDLVALAHPREATVAADWKVVVEQWLYRVPPEAVAGAGAEALSWWADVDRARSWSAHCYRRLLGRIPGSSTGDWRRQFVPPNQFFETRPDGLSVIQVLPVSAGRCVVRRSDYSALASHDGGRTVLYLAGRLGPSARRADARLAASAQAGMTEFAYETAGARQEAAAVEWFHEWITARLPSLALDRPPIET